MYKLLRPIVCALIAGCGSQPVGPAGSPITNSAPTPGRSPETGPAIGHSTTRRADQGGVSAEIRLSSVNSGSADAIDVVGLAPAALQALAKAQLSPDKWSQIFALYVAHSDQAELSATPPVIGSYSIEGEVLRFRPQYPLEPGVRYRATFDVSRIPVALGMMQDRRPAAGAKSSGIEATIELPRPPASSTTIVTQVYPSSSDLPENLLKFYIHFSAAMSRGEAYERIRLLDSSGEPVDLPFLELDEELWDPRATRFTLLFDPGRIKRGLKPREEVGPVLEEGKRYTLVIDRGWPDATGNPLKEPFRKSFRAGEPDENQPDPSTWKVQPPSDGTIEPLVITFPEPLDHAMLQHAISIVDASDARVAGTVSIESEETRWQFVPDSPWKAGDYSAIILTTLEDRAGNSIARIFDVDLLEPISRRLETETVRLSFQVRRATGD